MAPETVTAHRNTVVEFRGKGVRSAVKTLRQSRIYPRVRAVVGAKRIRQVRSRIIKSAALPTVAQALATCSSAQQAELAAFGTAVQDWVHAWLVEQDGVNGLSWSNQWPGWAAG